MTGSSENVEAIISVTNKSASLFISLFEPLFLMQLIEVKGLKAFC